MRILITGAKGQLGQTLIRLLSEMTCALGDVPQAYENAEILGVDVDTLDIADANAVASFLNWDYDLDDRMYDRRCPPALIFNCAATTNVDGCETDADTVEVMFSDPTHKLTDGKITVTGGYELVDASATVNAIVGSDSVSLSVDFEGAHGRCFTAKLRKI